MKLEQLILALGGIAVLVAMAFPFMVLRPVGGQVISVSGWEMVLGAVEATGVVETGAELGFWEWMNQRLEVAESDSDTWKLVGLAAVAVFPFLFALFGLGYLVRGLRGKQYGSGIFILIVATLGAWALFYFYKTDFGLKEGFFASAGLGYWLAMGGMLAAAFSLFFERSGSRNRVAA